MQDFENDFNALIAHEIMLSGIDMLILMAKKHDGYIKSIRTNKATGEKWEIVVRRIDKEEE